MTTSLERVGGQTNYDFGFFSTNTKDILLGPLAPMPTGQFCEYAANTLLTVIAYGGRDAVTRIAYQAGMFHEWLEAPHATEWFKIKKPSPYHENPFRYQKMRSLIAIGDKTSPYLEEEEKSPYLVKPEEFADFFYYVVRAGDFGWGDKLIPSEVIDSARKIDQAIANQTKK